MTETGLEKCRADDASSASGDVFVHDMSMY
jgi:hypothetical protein